MKDKLLVWIGGVFLHFCVTKYIQDKYDCDLFTIIDVDNEKKIFFDKQKLVNFRKTWYYRDYVDTNPKRKPDLEYLTSFEKRTGINLWKIAYSDKSFYGFNDYYRFKRNEILSILEQECKLFENVLDEIKPDFLILDVTDSQHNYLLSDICKSRKIRVLMLGGARFGYRELISEEVDTIDDMIPPPYNGKNGVTFEEIQSYYKKFNFIKQIQKSKKILKLSTSARIKKFLNLIIIYGGKKYQNHFSSKGYTRWNILKTLPILDFKRRQVRKFVNKNFMRKIEDKTQFIYYPLHSEPERALSIAAPYFTNQIETITHIAKSIPVGYKVYVKDHPVMDLKGGRSIEFYKEIMKHPNVQLIHPSLSQDELIMKCSLVMTISGTGGVEAAIYGKPTIILADTLYSSLPSVNKLKNLENLPHAIHTSLQTKVNPAHLKEFIDFINKHSFQVDRHSPTSELRIRFYQKKIQEKDMISFLEDFKPDLEIISSEYIKKIKTLNNKKNQIKRRL